MAENLTRRPGVLEWSSFQYPFAIHPKSSVWIWQFLGHQVEAMKTALDFRALVTDMLTLERRSRRSRLVSTQRQHTHILTTTCFLQAWNGRNSGAQGHYPHSVWTKGQDEQGRKHIINLCCIDTTLFAQIWLFRHLRIPVNILEMRDRTGRVFFNFWWCNSNIAQSSFFLFISNVCYIKRYLQKDHLRRHPTNPGNNLQETTRTECIPFPVVIFAASCTGQDKHSTCDHTISHRVQCSTTTIIVSHFTCPGCRRFQAESRSWRRGQGLHWWVQSLQWPGSILWWVPSWFKMIHRCISLVQAAEGSKPSQDLGDVDKAWIADDATATLLNVCMHDNLYFCYACIFWFKADDATATLLNVCMHDNLYFCYACIFWFKVGNFLENPSPHSLHVFYVFSPTHVWIFPFRSDQHIYFRSHS